MRAQPADGWERRRQNLLGQYERVALELFASRGYRKVTVEDIAAEAGISIRTAYRYFPTKEDCLLGLPRRGTAAQIAAIDALEPDPDPVGGAWRVMRQLYLGSPVDTELIELWLSAAHEAPEVIDRVRGARLQAVTDALVAYCERSLGVTADLDARPRLIAGVLVGVEFALIESASRSPDVFDELIAKSDAVVDAVRPSLAAGDSNAGRRSR